MFEEYKRQNKLDLIRVLHTTRDEQYLACIEDLTQSELIDTLIWELDDSH